MNADERAMIVIATLSDREQEALDRLYIEGHEPARICSEMRCRTSYGWEPQHGQSFLQGCHFA
jgi:DNA-directed RNA polymerase specialized sigma24 family protein